MSTSTDGAPPSVAPEPDETEGSAAGDTGGAPPAETGGSVWLHEEIQRRIAARESGSGGRHARRGATGTAAQGSSATLPFTLPRHASEGLPGPVPAPGRPAPGRPRRDRILAESADRGAAAWADPAPPAPASTPAVPPGLHLTVGDTALGSPSLPLPPAPPPSIAPPSPLPSSRPPRPAPHVPPLPAPPSGPAAARLLAPPPPSSAPPVTRSPLFTSRSGPIPPPAPARPAPPPAGPSEPETSWPGSGPIGRPAEPDEDGEVLWSASPAPPVPEQRTTGTDEAAPAEPRGARFPRSAEPVPPAPTKRVRVVLAERKGVARPVRTVVDVEEGTAVGELLRSNLIGSQLSVALRFAVGAGLALGALPLLFALFPEIGRAEILGLRLPWLLLGVLVYPFLLVLGWWHTRTAERVEQNFADHVQD